jgi:hypothetical protein
VSETRLNTLRTVPWGCIEFTEILLEKYKPDIVFTHWPIDFHMDHRAATITPKVLRCRRCQDKQVPGAS